MKVVAVPGSVATWTKLVHPDPVQRSIVTEIWGVVPFVHFRPIELARERDRRQASMGRSGGATAVTTIEPVAVLDAPPSSVTVSDAVYVPGVGYR